MVKETARAQGVPAESLEVILDLGGSKPNIGYGESPCLTHSRGKAHAFMSLQHAAVLSTNGLCKLSGLNMSLLNTEDITRAQLGGILGNGACPQVVARVLSSGLMALAEQCGMARVQVPNNFKDMSYRGYESGEVVIEGMDRDPALKGPTGTWLGHDSAPERACRNKSRWGGRRPAGGGPGPARGGPGAARGGPRLARGGSPTAAPQGRGRDDTRRSVSQELACSNNSRSPDTSRRPACGGPGPAGAGTPITAPQGCGHGVTRRLVPQELACSHNNRSPGTVCGPACGGPGPACGGPGPAGGGPPITAPQGRGRGVTRRSVPQKPARHDNSRSRGTRREPARGGSNTMSNRFQRPRLLWCQPP